MHTIRFQRLTKHLEKVETLTGGKLRKTPRFTKVECPIENFAPGIDKAGKELRYALTNGDVYYGRELFTRRKYAIYSSNDSAWWYDLSPKEKYEYTNATIKWLKERPEGETNA